MRGATLITLLAALWLAACDSGKTSPPAPDKRPEAKKQEGDKPQPGKPDKPSGVDPAALPGAPGSIAGKLASPYARLATGVVYIEQVRGKQFPLPATNPVMDQKNKIFTPHVLPVLAGSTVDFPNSDDVRHSVYARKPSAVDFTLGKYGAGVVKHVKFDKVGLTHLGCNVHTEMSAYILSLQNPYFAVTDKSGAFRIENVPPGRFKLTFFHERIRSAVLPVTVEPGQELRIEFKGLKRK